MNIICVDTNQWDLTRLKQQAQRYAPGAVIHGCRSPDRALELARSEGCDILLTEIDLLNVQYDGFMLAEKIKRLNPHVNIIFVTARMDDISPYRSFQLRASGYIRKPCQPEKMAEEFSHLRYAEIVPSMVK